MANPEHLKILKQGVEVWNPWKEEQDLNNGNVRVDLSKADLSGAFLYEFNLFNADLMGAHLRQAYLGEADLMGADLEDADLWKADLRGANLGFAYLIHTDLSDTDLMFADLSEADLSGADLSRANLSGAHLSKANLSEAKLTYANLTSVDLKEADLTKAFIQTTVFGDVDLRSVKGLETIRHGGPSTIGADTISRSGGIIPDIFLRSAGLSDSFIAYAHSLAQNPIKYYTCFISYSSKDEELARRLYADLQSNGVRCWFAPEDLKIGDKFWHRIDESIRLYDKLLVVLSGYSVQSDWVEHEVMAAFDKEKQGKLVLFPITLDDAVKDCTAPWAADLRRQRHIGDFTRWKNHDEYQKAFERLLRDLKASA